MSNNSKINLFEAVNAIRDAYELFVEDVVAEHGDELSELGMFREQSAWTAEQLAKEASCSLDDAVGYFDDKCKEGALKKTGDTYTLVPKLQKVMDELIAKSAEAEKLFFDGLSEEEVKAFSSLLGRVALNCAQFTEAHYAECGCEDEDCECDWDEDEEADDE